MHFHAPIILMTLQLNQYGLQQQMIDLGMFTNSKQSQYDYKLPHLETIFPN